jgi:chromate transporter
MRLPERFLVWLRLMWLFLRVNMLTTSGPASVGLLYKETVGKLLTEAQFVEAVGFSNAVPGSEALKLAMFVGFAAGGIWGTLAALLGTLLPPTLVMAAAASILVRYQGEQWIERFVGGIAPAVAILVAMIAWQIFRGERANQIRWRALIIAALSFAALWFEIPAPLVLIGAGILGVIVFR